MDQSDHYYHVFFLEIVNAKLCWTSFKGLMSEIIYSKFGLDLKINN
jgi:hypothetical protein